MLWCAGVVRGSRDRFTCSMRFLLVHDPLHHIWETYAQRIWFGFDVWLMWSFPEVYSKDSSLVQHTLNNIWCWCHRCLQEEALFCSQPWIFNMEEEEYADVFSTCFYGCCWCHMLCWSVFSFRLVEEPFVLWLSEEHTGTRICGMWETNVYGTIDTNERLCTVPYVVVTFRYQVIRYLDHSDRLGCYQLYRTLLSFYVPVYSRGTR